MAKPADYLAELERGVDRRTFALGDHYDDTGSSTEATVCETGRSIPKASSIPQAWKGHWPILREFLQNTVDHLHLLDGGSGCRQSALKLVVMGSEKENIEDDTMATFHFVIRQRGESNDSDVELEDRNVVCTIKVQANCVVIEQRHTFPLPARALDTGVSDTCKQGSKGDCAGGFGDGFKSAATCLLAQDPLNASLVWEFYRHSKQEKPRNRRPFWKTVFRRKSDRRARNCNQVITWEFHGLTRQGIGSFEKSRVMKVRISQKPVGSEVSSTLLSSPTQNNVMRQIIRSPNIGKSFLYQVIPRFQVFWDWDFVSLDTNCLISSRKDGNGDLLGEADSLPAIGGGILGPGVKPAPGVYVQGIWVCPPLIEGAIMCFFGNRLQVASRDRNDVNHEALVKAVANLWTRTPQKLAVKTLLEPLRVGGHENWLLRSPSFHNQVLHNYREYILRNIFEFPNGAVFVSRQTTESSDPFVNWASSYLERKGVPVMPIESGANIILFKEVSKDELMYRCGRLLTEDLRISKIEGAYVDLIRTACRRVLCYIGAKNVRVLISADVEIAFVLGPQIFVPELPLTRKLLLSVINVCHLRLGRLVNSEKHSAIMEGIIENLPKQGSITMSGIESAIFWAEEVEKENADLLAGQKSTVPESVGDTNDSDVDSPANQTITTNDDNADGGVLQNQKKENACTVDGRLGSHGGHAPGDSSGDAGTFTEKPASGTCADWEKQIKSAIDKMKDDKNANDCNIIKGGNSAPYFDPNVDNVPSLPISTMERVMVDSSLGGGALFCDASTAANIQSGVWDISLRKRIFFLRTVLSKAVDVVGRSNPSLMPLLGRIRHGYDSVHDTYLGFCDGYQIFINLYAYMAKLHVGTATTLDPRALIHDFVVTSTHELAHYLVPGSGHGPFWYDTHMKLLKEVMALYCSGEAASDGVGVRQPTSTCPIMRSKPS